MIPYNSEFSEALEYGKLQYFLNYNFTGPVRMENEYFMRKCKKSANIILNMISEVKKKKERQQRQIYIDDICKSGFGEFGMRPEYSRQKINSYK